MAEPRYPLYNGPAIYHWAFELSLMWCHRFPLSKRWVARPWRLFADNMAFILAERNRFWCVVNGGRIVLKPGDLVVLRGGDELQYGGDSAERSVVLSLGLRLQQRGGDDFLAKRAFERRYRLRDPRGYSARFDSIHEALHGPLVYRNAAVAASVLQWMIFVLKETRSPARLKLNLGAGTLRKVLDAQAWAESRLRETITLRDWARSTGWNPDYFGRVFKLETAYRPMKWLEERRMEVARELLLGGDRSIAQVAEVVGYPDSFYFSQVFKKHFGKPPLQYRKSGQSLATSQTLRS